MIKKRGLGRGLDALLGAAPDSDDAAASPDLTETEIAQIHRSPYQPRQHFDDEALAELAASIRAQGVMQPIVIRPRPVGGFEIIAGERRWRAAQLAGLTTIPAVVKQVADEQAVAMALIENIQREDLNPLEEAVALQRLLEEFRLTQQQVADAVGKSRVTVTNLLRLLQLSSAVREMLSRGELEMGHARALLSLPAGDQESVALQVVLRGLSVRQTEALVRDAMKPKTAKTRSSAAPAKDADVRRLEMDLSERIGAAVTIDSDPKGRGRVVIAYSNLDELDGILTHFK
ncbi:MAG: ParB/RepB/Spo0J family partition protein [Gammaproteobacteria bacterium]|nr:ParB/RepB/Spo0J family partition protein [Gammaproteobacteria bacterium]